jgi:DNA polymerase III delta prime subunit
MQSYLITGTKERVDKEIDKLIENIKALRLDFQVSKISDTKDLKEFTSKKLAQKTAIVINNFEKISEESQNAMLKNLEEPQENLFYILTAGSLNTILPTIISRCLLIETKTENSLEKEVEEKIKNFLRNKQGEKLKFTTNIKDREEASLFLSNIIFFLHKSLINEIDYNYKNILKSLKIAEYTLKNVKGNGNITLQLTNFVLNLGQHDN